MNKSKKYIIPIGLLIIGLVFGYLISHFTQKQTGSSTHPQIDSSAHPHIETSNNSEIWTCSMHPQIRQNEPGDCPICGMDLIPAKKQASSNTNGFQMTPEAIQLANIQTTIIGNTENASGSSLQLNGKIQVNETQSASIVTHIPGRIEKLFVSYTGEQVKKGQKIASIYSPELITAQKELIEAQKIEDISPGLLNAAKNKLKFWKISDQVIDDILSKGTVRETFSIYADHSGVVDQKKVSVGDYLTTGKVLFDVQNLNNLWALFDVYENDLSKIKVGRKISFTTPSAPSKTYKANITFVNPVINPQTRVATIRAEVYNSGGKLKPEMFISGLLNTTHKSSNLFVPKSAVLWTGIRSVVYVKIPDGDIPSFEYREIEIGEAAQSSYEVISGLEDGEEVVTNGAFVIDATAQLNNQASMMNKKVIAKNAVHSSDLPDFTSSTPSVFKTQLSSTAAAYILVKDALVESDSKKATEEVVNVLQSLDKIEGALIKEKAHIYWMQQLKSMKSHGNKISESDNIDVQREQFDFLSQALIKSLKVFGVDNDTFYVQHCPMANNNHGADWVSKQEKILNPYFGDKMLTCGTVHDTIDKDFKNPTIIETDEISMKVHNH